MRRDYYTFKKNPIMKNFTFNLALLAVSTLLITSCVDRKTKEDDGTIRLEAPTDNSADTEYTEALQEGEGEKEGSLSNEEMVEVAEAKTTINDYYDAFTRKVPREAFDMWKPGAQSKSFSNFSQENPNYETIEVTFDDNSETPQGVSTSGNTSTVTLPIKVSMTDSDGAVVTKSGIAKLEKDDSEDNSEYVITALDLTQEDS